MTDYYDYYNRLLQWCYGKEILYSETVDYFDELIDNINIKLKGLKAVLPRDNKETENCKLSFLKCVVQKTLVLNTIDAEENFKWTQYSQN